MFLRETDISRPDPAALRYSGDTIPIILQHTEIEGEIEGTLVSCVSCVSCINDKPAVLTRRRHAETGTIGCLRIGSPCDGARHRRGCEGDAGHLVQLLGAVGVRGRDKGWLFAHFTRNSTK
jgi:hypothetical protein